MIGQQYKYFGWEFGPFVRYWDMEDSDFVFPPGLPPGFGFYEPHDTRIQYGAALRINF